MEDQLAVSEISKTALAREITPEGVYLRRREFIRNSLLFTATSTAWVAPCFGLCEACG